MKIRTLAALLLLGFCALSRAAGYTAPADFRGHKWGMTTSQIGGLKLAEDDGKRKFYERTNDDKRIGDATVESIGYAFYQDRFHAVLIQFRGVSNATALLRALQAKYGDGSRPNQYMDRYYWGLSASDVRISYDYSDVTKEGVIAYTYVPIQKEIEAAAAAAAGDARSLL
jgi:hypothetical protein